MHVREQFRLFQQRLNQAFKEQDIVPARFSKQTGIARSTLSDLLKGEDIRLPRLDTIVALAEHLDVTSDWLLGLSNEKNKVSEIIESALQVAETEQASKDKDPLHQWLSTEMTDTKLRQACLFFPDHMATIDVLLYKYKDRYEHHGLTSEKVDAFSHSYRDKIEHISVEMCAPLVNIETFAYGHDIWSELALEARQRQLLALADRLEETYPKHQMYLYDGLRNKPPMFILYGHQKASLWIGSYHLIFHIPKQVEAFHKQFDQHIRNTLIYPHEAPNYLRELTKKVGE